MILPIYFLLTTPVVQNWVLPDNFQIGVSTSAYQIEGGWNQDGKGASIWDRYTQSKPERIADGTNGNIACDSYNKFLDDIALLKNLNVAFYRFSLSWSRILPDGFTGTSNQAGIDYYNRLINTLLAVGIEPVVTLYHWDLPQVAQPLGGWTNERIIEYFMHFARVAFGLFGDRVKTWVTINEPRAVCQHLHGLVGDVIEPYPSGTIEYLCIRNILLGHAEVYHLYDKEFRQQQKGEISMAFDFVWTEPANASDPADVQAAQQWIDFDLGIYTHPIYAFGFPQSVVDRVAKLSSVQGFSTSRLPVLSNQEKLRISGTFDYFGLNHYVTQIAKWCKEKSISSPSFSTDAGGDSCTYQDPAWEKTVFLDMVVVPWGLRKCLNYVKNSYKNPKVYILESGYPEKEEVLFDDKRLYLNATLQAIFEDGVNVQKFAIWSLLDNFEWTSGYTLKFGLYHVNFTDPARTRTAKKSAGYIKNVIATKSLE